MANFDGKFASAKSDWETPQWLFDLLDQEFHFECDAAANAENAKVENFIDKDTNALRVSWHGTCWLNPPYSKGIGPWVEKAYREAMGYERATVVMLVPARTNTVWWHRYCMEAAEVRFILGRPKFGGAKHGLPQPLAVVVFKPNASGTIFTSLDIRGRGE